jgi:hypothetical protein
VYRKATLNALIYLLKIVAGIEGPVDKVESPARF